MEVATTTTADALGPDGIRVNAIHPGIIETTMTTEDVPIVGTGAADRVRERISSRRSANRSAERTPRCSSRAT